MRKMITMFLLSLCIIGLTACGKKQSREEGTVYQIFEVNKDETKVSSYDFVTEEEQKEKLVSLLLEQLSTASDNTESRAAISEPLKLRNYTITDENVVLDFESSYSQLSVTGEVLTRAAIVRTLTQIQGIHYVSFTVEDIPLSNRSGMPVGMMTAEQFLDNSGNEINTEEKVTLCLYFANETGDKLVPVNREVIYNSNISLDKLVMEQLILGVLAEEVEEYHVGAVINPDTKLVSVMVSDGVCYVNLDNTFLTQIANVNPDVTIFAIVNSLVELPNVNKVQFSINGETDFSLKETMSLTETYERNLEIVEEK